jgi:hypothetical protein
MRVEIKKRDQVTVIRFLKHDFKPQRKPSSKRFFRGIRALFPCQYPTITDQELEDLILKTFGSNYQYYILISDEWFRLIPKDKMEQLLKEDDTDTLPYINVAADCDDFSDVLLGQLTRKTWNQGFAIGQLWYINYEKNFGHAVNLFCDTDKKLWIIEPQNDRIIEWGSDPDYRGSAYMVKF